ncbi:tetratricopeptide repeat protein [Aquimarina litoralis]|uniref:tetratricopeptide repeat protein n=1 Tax=Aquimarina litoralis TaxID=584605 RepID=UPI001C5A0A5A|nr:tetratricopeptide repeat protein [Aquimarina litoralis]MBW1293950.1 tetratricopeptide repeat protein [Aquimarina litoralis]
MIKFCRHITLSLVLTIGLGSTMFSQEIESLKKIEIFDDLGDVSDVFRESFFEALKERAITNYEKAISALERCIEANPKPIVLYYELGSNYLELKQYDNAATNFKKVLEERPNDRYVLELLFEVYFTQRKYAESVEVVEKLVNFDSMYKEQLANLYFLESRYDDALRVVDELIEELGLDPYRDKLRKKISLKINNPNSQIIRLQEKIAANPKEEQNYLNLIYLYSQDNQVEKAFGTAQILLEQVPKSELAHLALYKYYLDDNLPKDAIKSMKVVLSSDKIDEESKYKVVNDFLVYVDKNPQYETKLIEVTKIFSEDAGNSKVFTEIGNYFYDKDRKELALNYYERGIKDNASNFGILRKILLLQLDLKRYEKAKVGSELAIELYPSQPILYLVSGVSLINLNDYEEAIDILSIGMDYIIDDFKMESDFYDQIGEAYLKMGNEAKAKEYKDRSVELKKKS